MKNLVNEINREMRESGNMWQIKRVNHKEMVSIEVDKLEELITELAFSSELQAEIQEAHIVMNEAELMDLDEEEWFLPYYSKKDRVKEYMEIYDEFCKEAIAKETIIKETMIKEESDDDIPF